MIHYVPTSCSWLNLIERWFAELTNKRIRRDSFFSVDELVAAINDFLAAWNENPKPIVWTATVDSIVAVQTKGFGFSFQAARKSSMVALRSATL